MQDGGQASIPLGERVRMLRAARGLSVRTLAARTDFSPRFISQVENGLASPSIASLGKIAEELGTGLAELFAEPLGAEVSAPGGEPGTAGTRDAGGAAAHFVPAAARRTLFSTWSQARMEALGAPGTNRGLEPVLITFSPGGRSGSAPHANTGELFALVFEGELRLETGGE